MPAKREAKRSVAPTRGAHAGPPSGTVPSASWLGTILPYGLLLLFAVIWCLPLLTSTSEQVLATPDITQYFQWIHGYAREQMLAGQVPLWNPYNYAGLPFAANPQCTVFYPPSWLYLVMPVTQAQKWMIAIHVLLAGSLMYLLLRRFRLEKASALLGTLPYMFGGYTMANAAVGHLPMLFTMSWLPLIVYCYERALAGDGPRWLVWTGAVLGVQLLAGEPQNTYYTVLLIGGYGLLRSLLSHPEGTQSAGPERNVGGRLLGWLGGLLAVGAVAAGISAVQLLLTGELWLHSDRSANSYEFITNRSFPFGSFLGFLVPWSDDFRGLTTVVKGHVLRAELNWEFAGYVGVFTLLLAAASLRRKAPAPLRAAWVLLAVALVLMLGGNTPLYRVLYRVLPGLAMFRIPARAVLIAVWALSVMAAFGYERAFAATGPHWRGRWRLPALVGVILMLAAIVIPVGFIGAVQNVRMEENWWRSEHQLVTLFDPPLLRSLVFILLSAGLLISLRWLPRRPAMMLAALLIAADLYTGRPGFSLRQPAPEEMRDTQLLASIPGLGAGEPFRVDLAPAHGRANAAMGSHVENVNGYWPLALRRFYTFVHAVRNQEPSAVDRHQLHDELYMTERPFLRLLNVRFASRLVKGDPSRDTVEENPAPLPRAWLADVVEVVPDERAALARVCEPEFDPARIVVLDHAPGGEVVPSEEPAGSCRTRMQPDGSLVIEAEASRPCYLVISQVYYPGWRAEVDGVAVPLERADYLISGLHLKSGTHRIVCQYEPLSFRIGLGTALTSWVAVSAYLFQSRRTARRRNRGLSIGGGA